MGRFRLNPDDICKSCYLSINNKKIPGREAGGKNDIILINPSPSSLDIRYESVLTGINDRLIKFYLDNYELTNFTYVTNLIKCHSSLVNDYYARKCLPFLIEEIQVIRPKIIISVGLLVYKILKDLDGASMSKIANKPIKYANSILIPIYDPAYINKKKSYELYDKGFELISNIYSEINPLFINPKF